MSEATATLPHVPAAMTRWDEIAAGFDHVRLRSFCNGRIKIGYPPAVGEVDINLTGRAPLSDRDEIGVMHAEGGMVSFALPLLQGKDVYELPGGRGILYGPWLLDLGKKKEITLQPVDTPLGFLQDDQKQVLLSYGCAGDIVCFDETGVRWARHSLLGGNIEEVQLVNGEVICFGWFDWDHSRYCLKLNLGCGNICGGDDYTIGLHSEYMKRARDHDIRMGRFAIGLFNCITDVEGVQVGHVTCHEGARTRTGATVIIPHDGNIFQDKCRAGLAICNGYGKLAGATQLQELGELETPILLTNTLTVGRGLQTLVDYTLAQPGNEMVTSINAVVGETNDSKLNDIRAVRPTVNEMGQALDNATSGPVQEGCVGAGSGTVAFGYKGGIGTASRLVNIHTIGVLVQSNFGGTLRVDGKEYPNTAEADKDGSIMIVIATDAPLCPRNLKRLATRSFAGLARIGSSLSNGSGDYAIAFSTAREGDVPNAETSPYFEAVIEATEEAILNSFLMAEDTQGWDAGQGAPNHVKAFRL